MEVRLALAAHVTLQDRTVPVTQLCREQGISRQAYYEYRARFLGGGVEGLLPRSRRPLRSPGATSADVIELVVAKHDALAAEGWDAGARSVRNWLVLEGVTGLPSWRTIHKYLARARADEADAEQTAPVELQAVPRQAPERDVADRRAQVAAGRPHSGGASRPGWCPLDRTHL